MNWKTRQLFSDREHGIVSGLSPINMVNGGSVPIPGYEDGGTVGQALREGFTEPMQNIAQTLGGGMAGATAGSLLGPAFEGATEAIQEAPAQQPSELSIEQRVAELAANLGISVPAARAMILKQMLEQQGVTLSEEVINQFATGLITLHDALAQAVGPPKMQDGGLALDLFEEGDQEINEPLNIMAQAVNPPLSDVGPTGPMLEETIDEETALMDQGPDPQSRAYEHALELLKNSFKEEIRNYVVEVPDSQKIKEYLKNVNMAYANALNKLKLKHDVEASSPNEELLDPLFVEEITQLMAGETQELPGYDDGGKVMTQTDLYKLGINLTLDEWNTTLSEDQRKQLILRAIVEKATGGGAGTTAPDTSTLDTLLKDRKALAGKIGKAARSSYSSSLPRILHYGAAKSAGELAEAEAMDKTLADQISAERGILSAFGRSAGGAYPGPTAAFRDAFVGVGGKTNEIGPSFRKRVTSLGPDYPNAVKRVILEHAELGAYPDPAYAVYDEMYESETKGSMTWIEYFNSQKDMLEKQGKLKGLTPGSRPYYAALMSIVDNWVAAIQAQKVKQ